MGKMKKVMNIIVVVFMIVCCSVKSNDAMAQKQKTPDQVMTSIYTAYDSISNLSFDVAYTYTDDSLNGHSAHESMKGAYTMSGKKVLYNLGNIQFMQNDSFFIAVYNDEKFILVTNPRVANVGSNLPMRSMMDSMLHSYAADYTISVKRINDSTNAISFVRADSLAKFDKLTVSYSSKKRAFLRSISYNFKQASMDDNPTGPDNGNEQPVYHTKNLTINFSNYRVDNFSKNLYDEGDYIKFDNGNWVPADKYENFKIYYTRTGAAGTQSK